MSERVREFFPDGITPIDEWFYDTQVPALENLGTQYDITKYGVKDDGKVYTKEFQNLIDRIAEQGGGVLVWDVSKAIDSLDYFKEKLDLDDIMLIGHSGGGTATYYSACYDERIKLAVPSCAVYTYRESIGEMWHCTCNYIPQIAKYVDMGELATLIAPRKLIVGHGEKDAIFPLTGTKKVYSVIEKIYKKENVKNNCRLLVYPDRPHYFDKELVFPAIKAMRGR